MIETVSPAEVMLQKFDRDPIDIPISEVIEYNELPIEDRQKLVRLGNSSLSFVGFSPEKETTSNEIEHSVNVDNFLYRGWALPVKTFESKMASLKKGSPFASRIQVQQLSDLLATLGKTSDGAKDFTHSLGNTPILGEIEALLQLESFLNLTHMTAQGEKDTRMAKIVKKFKEGLGFIDEQDFENGCVVIVDSWARHLLGRESDSNILLYNRQNVKKVKSFEYVSGKLTSLFNSKYPELTNRLKTDPGQWDKSISQTRKDLLVVVDDWIVSGKSVVKIMSDISDDLSSRGWSKSEIANLKKEVHVIAKDETAMTPVGYDTKAVYQLSKSKERNFDQVSFFGSHSTPNYGFDYKLRDFQKYLQSKGIFKPAPLFAGQEAIYRHKKLEQDSQRLLRHTKFGKIALDNSAFLDYSAQYYLLERRLDTGRTESDDFEKLRHVKRTLEGYRLSRMDTRKRAGFKQDNL